LLVPLGGKSVKGSIRWAVPAIAVIVAALAVVSVRNVILERSPAQPAAPVTMAPAIAAPDLHGRAVSLGDYHGKVLLVDFWATWCPPCLEAIPRVKQAYAKYHADGFDVLGISQDTDRAALTSFVRKHDMPWRQVFDTASTQSVAATYGVGPIPRMFLIDGATGEILNSDIKPEELDASVGAALKARAG
jgi:peroxiredoxin